MDSLIQVKIETLDFADRNSQSSTPQASDDGSSATEIETPIPAQNGHRQTTFDDKAIRPRPVNRWQPAQRITLAWLFFAYQPQWKAITSIFNKYFEVQLPTQKGLTEGALRSMYAHMRLRDNEQNALYELDSPTISSNTTLSREISRPQLEKLALDHGIDHTNQMPAAVPNHLTTGKIRKAPNRKRKALNRGDTPDGGFSRTARTTKPAANVDVGNQDPNSSPSDAETDFLPRTPKRQCRVLVPHTPDNLHATIGENGLPTPPNSSNSKQQPMVQGPKRLPRVAFRAFSDSSQGLNSIDGFLAGSFTDSQTSTQTIQLPPSPDDAFYLHEAARHVARVHTGSTSFISLSRNLLRCLHRAIKAGPDSSIAVIDMEKANSKGAVQSAMALRIKANCVYKPWGEYLVWAQIPKPAIISVVPLTKLLAAMPTMPGDGDPFGVELVHKAKYMSEVRTPIYQDPLPMSFQSGQAIGKLMKAMAIPSRIDLLEGAVYSIISDWKFSGKWKRWQKNTAFREGLEKGYFGEHNGQLLSLVDSGEEDTSNLDEEPEGIEEEILPVDGTNQTSEIEDEDATISLDSEEELQENSKQRIGDIANYSLLEQPNLPNEGTFVDGFIATREDLIVDDDRDNRVTGQRIGQEILSKIRAEEETKLLQLDYAETYAWTGM